MDAPPCNGRRARSLPAQAGYANGARRHGARRVRTPGEEAAMLVDLVQVWTRDGLRLAGAFQAASAAPALPVDALCFVHGTGGNFYSSTLFDALAERVLALGCTVLRVNTRGHDLMSNAALAQGGRRQGAAYEVVDDC